MSWAILPNFIQKCWFMWNVDLCEISSTEVVFLDATF